jgi:hypothetical protein
MSKRNNKFLDKNFNEEKKKKNNYKDKKKDNHLNYKENNNKLNYKNKDKKKGLGLYKTFELYNQEIKYLINKYNKIKDIYKS